MELFKYPEEFKKEQKELLHLGKTLTEGLKDYSVIWRNRVLLSKIHYHSNINKGIR